MNPRRLLSTASACAPGILALLAAVPIALLIQLIHRHLPHQPERAVQAVGALFVILLALPAGAYVAWRRQSTQPATLGLLVLVTVAVLLVSTYLYRVSFQAFFPADILIWSESDFVNDILKFRVGYPLYSPQVNNESFPYPPGAQLFTYFLAWLTGHATSISAYRVIQVVYSGLSALMAVGCCRRLAQLSSSTPPQRDAGLWYALWLPLAFLMATNSLTNPFTKNLHNDALAQLIWVIAYWLLLEYIATRSLRVLALMSVIPVVGFLVKQSLLIWIALFGMHLLLFDRPRSLTRLAAFVATALAGAGAVTLAGYGLWGSPFGYWVLLVLGKHGVSPLRAVQHVLDVWPYLVIGILGGVVLVRGESFDRLLSPWLVWLCGIGVQAYTSGVAWMLNHLGPGCLIAGIWFLAALPRLWSVVSRAPGEGTGAPTWLRAVSVVGLVGLLFCGLGIVQVPMQPFSDDAYRYVGEIEREFLGHASGDILLDAGTWVYVRDGVIMKDRAPSIGERGYSETGDFSGMLDRLTQKRYTKILVRNLHSPDFWYDHWLWRKSSGIRETLLHNYREVGRIAKVSSQPRGEPLGYLFEEISILEPNPN